MPLSVLLAEGRQRACDGVRFVEVAGADAYLQNIQVAIGETLTGNSGLATEDVKANLQRGQVATQEWLNDNHARIDPVSLGGGGVLLCPANRSGRVSGRHRGPGHPEL